MTIVGRVQHFVGRSCESYPVIFMAQHDGQNNSVHHVEP